MWRRAYQTERERLLELQAIIQAGEMVSAAKRKRAIEAAASAAAAGAALVAVRPSADAWRRAYEGLRDANTALERVRSGSSRKIEDPPPPVRPSVPEGMSAAVAAAVAARFPPPVRKLRGKLFSIGDLQGIALDEQRLAEVGQLREALGPGTMPLLAALFGEAASEGTMPALPDVQLALGLAGSRFRVEKVIDLTRCFVVRGLFKAAPQGESANARTFLDEVQQRLDAQFGCDKLVVFLQRERYATFIDFGGILPRSAFQDMGSLDGAGANRAALFIFLKSDLPVAEDAGPARRIAIGLSFAVTLAFCSAIPLAIGVLQMQGNGILEQMSTQEATYSETFGVAVTRLDFVGLLPISAVLLLTLAAQDVGRNFAATRHGIDLRPGFLIPWPSVGWLGRTWDASGLIPSRQAEFEVVLGGRVAALAVAALACCVGALRGDAASGLLLCEPGRLPALLVQALGASFPTDPSFDILSLKDAVESLSSSAGLLAVDPLLFGGSLAATAQAAWLLPLGGLDGYTLLRFLLGPRPARALELVTAVLLTIGAFGRLGPMADQGLCLGMMFAWAATSLASAAGTPMPPREDFEDSASEAWQWAAASALLLGAAAVLLPGRLVPYGVLESNL